VLVVRTPYGRPKNADRFVQAGYIVVCQDARGRYGSGGTWESFVRFETHDAVDGYDTIEWAAKLPGSTGEVGTYGASYNAFLQWRAAALRPPSLKVMSAHSIPARYTDLEGPGTIRPGRRLNWWVTGMTPEMRRRSGLPGGTDKAELVARWRAGESEQWLGFLPWLDLPREAFEEESDAVKFWLRNPHTDPWQLDRSLPQVTVPNFNVVGWYDHCNGDLLLDRAIRATGGSEAARTGSRTLIGPWGHTGRGVRKYGDIDFGEAARTDITAREIEWFDHWLKGRDRGVTDWPSYRIFVMGDNRWRDEADWPLARATEKVLHLTSGGRANTPAGDGRLVAGPSASEGVDQYVFDPSHPVPSLHGPALFVIPTDQRPLADRRDILVYQTEPLTERVEVTGNPVVELYAASSAPDTDFFVRLIDVAPDGQARDVSLGMVRARYRNGLDRPELIAPGAVVRYTIRMNPTSNAFLPGHRLRLDVTSSDFPNYDRNHNTAADQNADATLQSATQTVHHGGEHATRLILPWIEESAVGFGTSDE
jgi:putative CocE/NonD family hydrolase